MTYNISHTNAYYQVAHTTAYYQVAISTDTTPPEFISAEVGEVNDTSLVITYDEALNESSTPATGDFAVTRDSTPDTVTDVDVSGTTVTLTLSDPVRVVDVVTFSYTSGTNPLKDAYQNECIDLTDESVTNNVT